MDDEDYARAAGFRHAVITRESVWLFTLESAGPTRNTARGVGDLTNLVDCYSCSGVGVVVFVG